jgi:TonB family protein
MRRLHIGFFILSLLIHFGLVEVAGTLGKWYPEKPKEVVEFTLVNQKPPDPKKSDQGTVVRKLNLPDLLKAQATKNNYDLLADELQRVKEQIKALRAGVTENRGEKSNQPTESGSGKTKSPNQSRLKVSDILDGYKINPLESMASNDVSFEEVGQSTLGVELPDGIKAGMFTALNTDRYLYSSYYNRVEELTLPEWSPMLDSIIQRPPNALVASIHRRFSGLVEIWSKPSGEIVAVKLLKSFGITEFDQSLLEAFRRVKVIPNPPKDKMGPDGIARVQMGGFITLDPKVLSRR